MSPVKFNNVRTTSSKVTQICAAVLEGVVPVPGKLTRTAKRNLHRRAYAKMKRNVLITSRGTDTSSYHVPISVLIANPTFFALESVRQFVDDSVFVEELTGIKCPETKDSLLRCLAGTNCYYYSTSNFHIVDTTNGFIQHDDTGKIVFALARRSLSLELLGNKSAQDIELLQWLIGKTPNSKRSDNRQSFTSSKVVDSGYKAMQGTHGVALSSQLTNHPLRIMQLSNLSRRMEMAASSVIPTSDLHMISQVKKCLADFKTLSPGDEGFSSAISVSKNYMSSAHTDNDFFFSTLTLRHACSSKLFDGKDMNSAENPPPAHHFIFPTLGIAVAVRPGDVLVFNPTVFHACSLKLNEYAGVDVFVSTIYLKTAVVGGNDNRKVLSTEQQQVFTKISPAKKLHFT